MRLIDLLLVFPSMLLALSVVAVLGGSLGNVMIAVGIAGVPQFTRVVRAAVLGARALPYVEAARGVGCPDARQDPGRARQLLDQAGWRPGSDGVRVKDGRRLATVVNVKDDPQALDMLQVMQANLKQVGMEREIRPMALAASEDLARKGENGLTFMDRRGTDPRHPHRSSQELTRTYDRPILYVWSSD